MYCQSHHILSDRVELLTNKGLISVFPLTDRIVRCVYTRRDEVREGTFLVEPLSKQTEFFAEADGDQLKITVGEIVLSIDLNSCIFTWSRISGEPLLREIRRELREIDVIRYREGDELKFNIEKTADGDRISNKNLVPYYDRTAYRGKLCFEFDPDEPIYGLGQAEEGIYNCRGRSQFLYQTNMRIPIPFLLSGKKYALFFDCGSVMTFNDDYHGSYVWFDTIEQMDTYFILGDCFDDLIAGFRKITGRATMLPKWAFGYIQSKEAYLTQQQLIDAATEYRRRNIPLDCIVQDWRTWEPNLWGEKVVDKSRYPNLAAAIDELHKMNVRIMVSIWPNMNIGGTNHKEFEEKGWLLPDHATYNPYLEPARKLYWEQAKKEFFNSGVDAWWCDSSEGFCRSDWNGELKREPWERFCLVSEELKRHIDPTLANTFCVVHAKGIYEGQRAATQEKRVVNLTRSGYPSQQKYGTILWSGDIPAKWSVLKNQIAEGIRFCMSGMPYWTLDIGAFFVASAEAWKKRPGNEDLDLVWFRDGDYDNGVADPAYRELYTRWLEFGCFLPIFRSHGTDTPREIWNFGEEGEIFYDSIAKFIRLRYRLIPYIYSIAARCVLEDYTMLRGLAFDFLEDKAVKDIRDEFMFGQAFLVCPVYRPMYYEAGGKPIQVEKTWECYLPAGTDWYDYWDGRRYNGGQKITIEAPIDRIPLFVRAGSIIPMTETVQYAEQESEKSLEIHVYPGADGIFSLYEDSGDGYGYEHGEYAITDLVWDDEKRTLKIGARKGSYPGMKEERAAEIVVGSKRIPLILDGNEKKIICQI
ncbi:MAG: TIM-barrel domain-containing protein [Bacillota bacterium]